jgi:hypothetical protein
MRSVKRSQRSLSLLTCNLLPFCRRNAAHGLGEAALDQERGPPFADSPLQRKLLRHSIADIREKSAKGAESLGENRILWRSWLVNSGLGKPCSRLNHHLHRIFKMPFCQFQAQFFQGPALDLAHPLFGNAQAVPERFERCGFIGEPPLK